MFQRKPISYPPTFSQARKEIALANRVTMIPVLSGLFFLFPIITGIMMLLGIQIPFPPFQGIQPGIETQFAMFSVFVGGCGIRISIVFYRKNQRVKSFYEAHLIKGCVEG